MANSPFRTKYQQEPAYKHVKYVELRCLRDGGTRTFIDDGPFPKTPDGEVVANWQSKNTHSGRSQLLRKMKERESDPTRPDEADALVPLFVWDSKEPPPKIWDPKVGDFMSPVVMNDHHRKVMEVFCAQRHEIALEQKAMLAKKNADAKQAEADADQRAKRAAEDAATAILEKFADVMNKGGGKRTEKGGAL